MLDRIRQHSPLVHNITNHVVMNFTANALLAAGASPVMAHAPEEVADMARLAGALVVNMGTLDQDWIESARLGMHAARAAGKPIAFDPVGVGATKFRTQTALALLEASPATVIRGNASEILALAQGFGETKGVDSLHSSESALRAAEDLSRRFGGVVCVSGATDYVVSGERRASITAGDARMTRVTGMGCAATALIGAFLAVEKDAFKATEAAMWVMARAGESAARTCAGPGSLAMGFLDELSRA